MSSIGFSNIGALNLAGSVAGTQTSSSDTDRIKQNGATQKAAADRDAQSAQALGDVAETDLSSERDADGREPFGQRSRPGLEEETGEQKAETRRVPDARGERGNALDLQA